MKIIILHGDYITKLYARLEKFKEIVKKRGWEILYYDRQITDKLSDLILSQSLFGREKLIIINGFNSLTERDLKWLKQKSKALEGNVVIYNEGQLPITKLSKFTKQDKIEEFKLPRLIFNFLDSFFPGNCANCLKILKKLITDENKEFVLALLGRHLKDLYLTKISANLSYPSWRIDKLKRQASNFDLIKLKQIIFLLAEEDVKSKTSQSNLKDSLDFLIATKLV